MKTGRQLKTYGINQAKRATIFYHPVCFQGEPNSVPIRLNF